MKDLIILAILIFAGWSYYQDHVAEQPLELSQFIQSSIAKSDIEPEYVSSLSSSHTEFQCDGRKYCSQMTSKREALFFHHNCPGTLMDGDADDQPCENSNRF
ncbi:excalibur calcium-binding domain-containing protein [Shewanella gelidii]|uniref:Excalibur calcium-binding domain-containing protein n=1 Tax=Shewanella gelidii TaxID=1642821 RepID=A0A917NCP7_9GAMM|nr:excalibur calcium-binding domain-containing protein [Shewanella gelidii]MCL1098905.1 tetratricopeptide repeat protein [Shewanella gelidii]GGI89832.1 hypothetical protein GCM10009332_29020 [Shewanella gelidii]